MKNKLTLLFLSAALLAFAAASSAQLSITGAGASFPYPMYSKWFDEYHKAHPDVQINYQPIGSGGGIKNVTEGTVDFGASDIPMTDKQIADFKAAQGTNILHFPTVVGAAVPLYNIPGVETDLVFSGPVLAGIFLGNITKWNDPAIAKDNPKIKLPANDIVVVHRSDSSGTSFIWTDYLSKVSPEWKSKVGAGAAVNWPTGLGGNHNEGVAGTVKQTANSIGYVELIFAKQNKMSYGRVKNGAGTPIKAEMASCSEAAAGVEMPADFRVSITDPKGKTAYPIASFTWLLIPEKIKDPQKEKAVRAFLAWMIGTGQTLTAPLDYAPLPKPVVEMEKKALGIAPEKAAGPAKKAAAAKKP
jgi:phosphate transport system substrate-binding protein